MTKKPLAVASLIFTLCLQVGIQESEAQQPQDIVKAAEAGDARAQFLLGNMYNSGRGQGKNVTQAAKWFRKAADQGDVDAMFHLGVMLERGRGTIKNVQEAVKWYRAAADAGHADAMYTLSLMYSSGNGLPKDGMQADNWYNKAVSQWENGGQSKANKAFLRHE